MDSSPSDSVASRGAAIAGTAAAVLKLQAPAAAVAGQASLARRTLQDVAPGGAADPVLRVSTIDEFFSSDGAPARDRHAAPATASSGSPALYRSAFAKSRALTAEASRADFRPAIHREPTGCRSSTAGWCASISAPAPSCSPPPASRVTDLDGNVLYDLTGSYGVNVFGNDFYKECIAERGSARSALGPVLGAYHPVVADNVDAAARDLRARRSLVPHVRHRGGDAGGAARALSHRPHRIWCASAGAYHGWWGDVQPGVGNPIAPHETYTLADMSERTLRVLRTRAATSPACWSIRCRRCIPTPTRRPIRRWSTARATAASTAPPTPNG